MCPFGSGSKAAAASSVPLERDQDVFVSQHHITHSRFSPVSVLFPFSYPLPLSPTDPQPLSLMHRLTTELTLPWSLSFQIRDPDMV